MAEYQTTVDNLNVVRGNALLEIAPYTSGDPVWTSVGAITDLAITEETQIASEENDNADSTDRVNKQEVMISFTQLEILDLDVWEAMRGSLDTITQESQTTKIQSGNKSGIPYCMIRTTTKNGEEPFYFIAYRCNIRKGFEFAFQPDDAEDTRLKNTVELIGKTDPNRGGLVWELQGYFNG